MVNAISELHSFRQFLDEQISTGADLTPEESLLQWRRACDLQESVAAVKQALAEVDAGKPGKPLEDFVAEFRTKNHIPADAGLFASS